MATRAAPRSTFSFDLSKPLKQGFLQKQGKVHRAFKKRFFVLYPGFLVYYADQSKWKFDLAKGETLGSRIGAIKLKNGTAAIARDVPKGCKFGLLITAPDPANKRTQFLLNASSKDERNAWIEAIGGAVPRAKLEAKEPKKDEPPQRYKSKLEAARPTYIARQDTADAAAIVASDHHQELEDTDTTTEVEPSMEIRRDTINVAALAAPILEDEEDEEQVTSIDQLLGPQLSHDSDDDTTSSEGARTPTPLEADETVEETVNGNGKVEVVTSVIVVAVGSETDSSRKTSSPESEPEATETKNGALAPSPPPEPRERTRSTSEVTFPQENNSVVVTSVSMGDTSDATTSSSDDDDDEYVVPPTGEEPEGEAAGKPEETTSEDARPNGKPEIENGPESGELSPESSAPPLITVEKVDTLKRQPAADENGDASGKESGGSDSEKESLMPVGVRRERRGSAPFIEKRGFLYKMGGKRKNWKLRYFVLQPGTFSYYKKDPRSKPLGEVKLKNLQIFFPAVGQRKQSFQFTVHTESSWNKRMDWVMAAQSEREMKEWITAFKLAGTKGLSASPTPERELEPEQVTVNGQSNGGQISATTSS